MPIVAVGADDVLERHRGQRYVLSPRGAEARERLCDLREPVDLAEQGVQGFELGGDEAQVMVDLIRGLGRGYNGVVTTEG